MKTVLKEFLMVAIFCSSFLINAKPGEPELVFDENDPEIAVGIKVNLPGTIANRIILDYLKGNCPNNFDGTQEQFNEKGMSLNGDYKSLADYIIQQYMRNDLYIPGFVLEDDFLQKLKALYFNGLITCGHCSNSKYWVELNNMLRVYF